MILLSGCTLSDYDDFYFGDYNMKVLEKHKSFDDTFHTLELSKGNQKDTVDMPVEKDTFHDFYEVPGYGGVCVCRPRAVAHAYYRNK